MNSCAQSQLCKRMDTIRELDPAEIESLRVLPDSRAAGDALVLHYTFDHPVQRVRTFAMMDGGVPIGFLTVARTGMDLFRPLVLPFVRKRFSMSALIGHALAPSQPFILHTPLDQLDWVNDLVMLENIQEHELLRLDPSAFEPVLNILVVEDDASARMPRYEIRTASGLHAAAGVSWKGERFAEVYLEADQGASERRMTRSVLSAAVGRVLGESRIPIFRVKNDDLSMRTEAFHIGFRPTGVRTGTADALRRPPEAQVRRSGA